MGAECGWVDWELQPPEATIVTGRQWALRLDTTCVGAKWPSCWYPFHRSKWRPSPRGSPADVRCHTDETASFHVQSSQPYADTTEQQSAWREEGTSQVAIPTSNGADSPPVLHVRQHPVAVATEKHPEHTVETAEKLRVTYRQFQWFPLQSVQLRVHQ